MTPICHHRWSAEFFIPPLYYKLTPRNRRLSDLGDWSIIHALVTAMGLSPAIHHTGGPMEIEVTQEQGRVPVTLLHVTGSVDGGSYQLFQTRAQEEIERGAHDMLLDLTQVPYMSSAGLRAVNAIFQRLHSDDAGGMSAARQAIGGSKAKSPHFKLLNPTPRVLQVLSMAGYDMFLEIYHDPKEAVASF